MSSNDNLYAILARRFPSDPESIFLIDGDERNYSYADLERESARFAQHLTNLGLNRGDRVTVQVEKSPQALWLFLACVRGGFVFHPLNPAYTPREVEFFLRDAKPMVVIYASALTTSTGKIARQLRVPHSYTLDSTGGGSLLQASKDDDACFDTVASGPDGLVALLYSSGTTGRPKGIMLSHENLASNMATLSQRWGFTHADSLLHALPIFHVHGLFVAVGCVLMSGAQVLFLSKFTVENVLAALPHTTTMMGVPTYYTRLLEAGCLNRDNCAHMRLFICGSAPLKSETLMRFETATGHRILERYGMTETSILTSNPLTGVRKPGTVGLPLDDVDLRIVDDAARLLPRGEIGHVQVRGPSVFLGYWQLPERTAEDFSEDGFFNTGDDGYLDNDGYLTLVGRNKDVVISGGLNVYPKEIEILLDALPAVQESAVIGVPDPDFGEVVVAVCVMAPGETLDSDALSRDLAIDLADYKVPKKYYAIDVLPRNAMGKVQKNLLREKYVDSSCQ